MAQEGKATDKRILNAQQVRWNTTFAQGPDMFGKEASLPAQKAAALFKQEGKNTLLELGGGQGRDTVFFAQNGFEVYVLDYAESAIEAIEQKDELAQSQTTSGIDPATGPQECRTYAAQIASSLFHTL